MRTPKKIKKIKTKKYIPIYASDLSRIKFLLFLWAVKAALIPAIIPCAAASSYPVVPFN